MNCKITLTANAGVVVQSDICFTLDALHDIKSEVFPSLSPEMTERVFALTDDARPDAMLVTHEHIDHFSRALVSRAAKRYPEAALIDPASIKAGKGRYSGVGFSVSWYPLPHAKVSGFESVANYGFLVEFGGRSFFAAGDAEPTAPETLRVIDGLCPDVALLNFTWVSRRTCREALERLDAKRLVIFHLPFPERDPYGYIPATALALRDYRPEAAMLNGFLQSVEFQL